VNARRTGRFTGWHFDEYLRYRGRQAYEMGGGEWIRSPLSWARFRRVRRGDLFLCYQSDERKIYGLARAATSGYESLPGSGIFDSVDFEPRGLRLRNPVDLRHPLARETFQNIRAFTVPSRGTIHALAADDLRAVLRQVIAFNPNQRKAVQAFAKGTDAVPVETCLAGRRAGTPLHEGMNREQKETPRFPIKTIGTQKPRKRCRR
jgi:hypothetical protein